MIPPLRRRARSALADAAGAWIFYSVLPGWPGVEPRFERIARFAPAVGAVLGGLQGLLWWLTAAWLPAEAGALLVLVLGLWLSGGLHADGAMDTADGLAAGPRALEAMDDSRVGAAGVQALVLVLLLKLAGLLCLAPLNPWAVAVALVWSCWSARMAPLLAMQAFPYLREGSGTASFHRRHWRGLGPELLPALVVLGLLSGVTRWPEGWLGLLPALLVPWWLGRRLGGHSGDSYGACVEWTGSWSLLLMGVVQSALT